MALLLGIISNRCLTQSCYSKGGIVMQKTWEELYSLDIMKEFNNSFQLILGLCHNKTEILNFWNWYYTFCSKECPGYAINEDEYKTVLDILHFESITQDPNRPWDNALVYHLKLTANKPEFNCKTLRGLWAGGKAIQYSWNPPTTS